MLAESATDGRVFVRSVSQSFDRQLDGFIFCNANNTVFGSKGSAICTQAVYFLRSTMHSVM